MKNTIFAVIRSALMFAGCCVAFPAGAAGTAAHTAELVSKRQQFFTERVAQCGRLYGDPAKGTCLPQIYRGAIDSLANHVLAQYEGKGNLHWKAQPNLAKPNAVEISVYGGPNWHDYRGKLQFGRWDHGAFLTWDSSRGAGDARVSPPVMYMGWYRPKQGANAPRLIALEAKGIDPDVQMQTVYKEQHLAVEIPCSLTKVGKNTAVPPNAWVTRTHIPKSKEDAAKDWSASVNESQSRPKPEIRYELMRVDAESGVPRTAPIEPKDFATVLREALSENQMRRKPEFTAAFLDDDIGRISRALRSTDSAEGLEKPPLPHIPYKADYL